MTQPGPGVHAPGRRLASREPGRPALRTATWRAAWGCLKNNRAYAARYRHLTTRENDRLKPTQAQTVVAAAILRQVHAVLIHQPGWDPQVAARPRQGRPP
jgi:transposase